MLYGFPVTMRLTTAGETMIGCREDGKRRPRLDTYGLLHGTSTETISTIIMKEIGVITGNKVKEKRATTTVSTKENKSKKLDDQFALSC
jgi:hypothetical protein